MDLSLLVPRIPALARGNETLTRVALIQREFNRNEVHNPLPDGRDLSIANNCLERGLWEIKLARPEGGKTVTLFHAWFTFPDEEYARLFGQLNAGAAYSKYSSSLAKYPGMGGFGLPLEDLRRVRSERELGVSTPTRDIRSNGSRSRPTRPGCLGPPVSRRTRISLALKSSRSRCRNSASRDSTTRTRR